MPQAARLRRTLAALLLLAATLGLGDGARAADPPAPTYAVISLIGDQITVFKRRPQFGTRIDPNEQIEIPVAEATFDRMAMGAAEAAIRRAQPKANVFQASIRDKRLFALQADLLAESAESRDLRAALKGLLGNHGATHLLLVTKRRNAASFKLVDGTVGEGMIAGIGFYVDTVTPLRHQGSNENSPGFLAPFAYLTVTLVEAGSLRVLKTGTALESTMSIISDSKSAARAWDTLTAEQKVDALEAVIKSGVARAASAALAE